MTALDCAPVVHDATDPYDLPTPSPWRVEVDQLLALAANLSDAGYDVGPVVAKVDAITAAVDEVVNGDVDRFLNGVDLVNLDPLDVAERVRRAGIDFAAHRELVHARDVARKHIAESAAAALRDGSDSVIAAMRKSFDPALKVVQQARAKGLTPITDTTALLNDADSDTIAAYRALGPAVADLDRVAGLRNQMTTVAAVGPRDYPMAAYVTGVSDLDRLDRAADAWRGDQMDVQVNVSTPAGTAGVHMAKRRRDSLGGPWLALAARGYQLRLNTGLEADAVLTAARNGDA